MKTFLHLCGRNIIHVHLTMTILKLFWSLPVAKLIIQMLLYTAGIMHTVPYTLSSCDKMPFTLSHIKKFLFSLVQYSHWWQSLVRSDPTYSTCTCTVYMPYLRKQGYAWFTIHVVETGNLGTMSNAEKLVYTTRRRTSSRKLGDPICLAT